MKFIGQYIQSFIARFRSDVYLEDIDTGTIASGGNLGLDSNNKIVKATESSGGISHDGSTANGVLTFKDADEATVEANLTFNGSTLSIEADSNTTADALSIDANSLTTGNAVFIDVDDSSTNNNTLDAIHVDYDKSGNAASGQNVQAYGLEIDMNDNATSNVGGIYMTGIHIDIGSANTNGSVNYQHGVDVNLAGGDANANNVGYFSFVENGGTDFKAVSSADAGDFFSIETTAHGATTLKTNDDDGTAAHFEIATDGDITLDSAGQIKLEPVAGNNILLDGTVTVDGGSVTGITTLGVDSVSLTAVQTSAESFADNDTSLMTSAAANDKFSRRAYFDFKGYGTTDGTNYERQQIMTDNKAPFLHSVASGTDGLDDLEHFEVLRLATHIMPRAGVLKLWKGWGSSAGTGTINVSIVKITPVANTTDDVTPVLVKNAQFTAVGNTKIKEINETSFSEGFAAGDMLYTVVLGSTANKLWYLSSTLEVEWS